MSRDRYFPGKGMTRRQHQQPGAVPPEWRCALHPVDVLCYCGVLRNDHLVMSGGDECHRGGFYFAQKPTGKGSSFAADPRTRVPVSRYEPDSDEEARQLEELEVLEEQIRSQAKEIRELKKQVEMLQLENEKLTRVSAGAAEDA